MGMMHHGPSGCYCSPTEKKLADDKRRARVSRLVKRMIDLTERRRLTDEGRLLHPAFGTARKIVTHFEDGTIGIVYEQREPSTELAKILAFPA